MRRSFSFTLCALLLATGNAYAEPPRERLPLLPPPGRLSLSLDAWRSNGDRVETGLGATFTIAFDKLAAPRVKVEAQHVAPPALAPATPEPTLADPPDIPALRPSEITRVLRAAWKLGDLTPEDDRLDALAARARGTAVLPELRLRAGKTVDRSLRLSSDEDGGSQQSTGGVGTYYEVRATFHLHRAIFADEEVAIARLKRERAEERRKLTHEVLEVMHGLIRALAKSEDLNATSEERFDALAKLAAATLVLDGLTSGTWSEVWTSAVARRARPSSPQVQR